jgi:hypothetical protein
MSSSLFHPSRGLRVADEIEQPAEESETVLSPESEPRRVRSERVGKGARVVEGLTDCVGNDVSHGFGILAVGEQIARDARWAGDGQALERDPLPVGNSTVVKANFWTTGLPSNRKRELMAVGRQVAEAVHRRCRTVRDDTLGRRPVPREDIGCELQPGRTELEKVRRRRGREVVYALSHPFEYGFGSQALEGGRGDARSFGLATSHKPPLILSDLCESIER